METQCAACGRGPLTDHLRVAGDPGERGLIPTTDRYGTALADIVRCQTCGHMQLARVPSAEELSAAYAAAESEDYITEEAGQRETANRILDRIEPQTGPRPERRIIDLGCWVGFFLDEAVKRGWSGAGVEPSQFASAYARDTLGLEVETAEILDAELEAGSFDAAFMGDVVEHLSDPGAVLERVSEVLMPEGVLALALPDAGSRVARGLGKRWWSVLPTHTQYFTRQSIATLLGRHGFSVLGIATAPKAFSVRYYLDRVGGYSPALAKGLVGTARATRLADRVWAPNFRDRMLVLARGPSLHGSTGGGATGGRS